MLAEGFPPVVERRGAGGVLMERKSVGGAPVVEEERLVTERERGEARALFVGLSRGHRSGRRSEIGADVAGSRVSA